MDRVEAERLLSNALTQYRSLSYTELVANIDSRSDKYLELTGPSGTEYQIEIQFMWDDKKDGDVRVSAGIDDGSLRGAFRPVCEDFIVTPDGRLVGE